MSSGKIQIHDRLVASAAMGPIVNHAGISNSSDPEQTETDKTSSTDQLVHQNESRSPSLPHFVPHFDPRSAIILCWLNQSTTQAGKLSEILIVLMKRKYFQVNILPELDCENFLNHHLVSSIFTLMKHSRSNFLTELNLRAVFTQRCPILQQGLMKFVEHKLCVLKFAEIYWDK
jgi:hypothetical protein